MRQIRIVELVKGGMNTRLTRGPFTTHADRGDVAPRPVIRPSVSTRQSSTKTRCRAVFSRGAPPRHGCIESRCAKKHHKVNQPREKIQCPISNGSHAGSTTHYVEQAREQGILCQCGCPDALEYD